MSARTKCLLSALFLVLLLGGAWWWFGRREDPQEKKVISQDRYIPPTATSAPRPPLRLTDVTTETGITFRHFTGGFQLEGGGDSRYMPETMGPGIILFDPDGDGDLDLFVTQGTSFPGQKPPPPSTTSKVYRQDAPLRFTDATVDWNLGLSSYGMGGTAADYDGDGDQDLLVTTWGGPRLFRNDLKDGAPHFVEVTADAGLLTPLWTDSAGRKGPDWSTSALFFDADRDGDLDLFVANYIRWSPETDVFASLDGKKKSFTIPDRYHGNSCRLFINQGGGLFEDQTARSGVEKDQSKSLGVAVWDFNADGLLDLVVANDTQPNLLFLNQGGGRFKESALEAGIAYDEDANTRAGMGIDVAESLNDAVPCVPIGNFSQEPVALYRMLRPVFFQDQTQRSGVAAVTQVVLTFGLAFADLDLDGYQDLLLANGHLEPSIQEVHAEISYAQPLMVLRNQGDGTFLDWGPEAGKAITTPIVARGLALGDLDGDGDQDLVVTTNGGPLKILRNDEPRDASHNLLRVRLRGQSPNTDALGAWLDLEKKDGTTTRRLVRTGSSYLSQSELVQTFGLGSAQDVTRLTVTWPDGTRHTFEDVPLNRTVTITQATGRLE